MNWKTITKSFFILLGVIITVVLVHKLGMAKILKNIHTLGWRAIPILAIGAVWYICYTVAWNQFLKRFKGKIGIFELFRAKIAGEAINTVTPANFIGGDPVRILIIRHHYPVTEGAASVVVDRTLQTIAILITIFFGMMAAFWKLPFLPLNMRYGLPIVLIISSIFMTLVFLHQRRGLFSFMIHMLNRLKIKRQFSDQSLNKFRELDRNIADFYVRAPQKFWIALSLHVCGRLLGIIEIYAVGVIFYPKFTLFAALLLGALSPLVNFVFAFIPGALGVLEGAYSATLYLLHMPPQVGISIQIFRRLRSVFWILVGFIFLAFYKRKKRAHV